MLTDGSQYNSVPDGLFRRPSEGQSLISYLSEQDFGSCADLEKASANSSLRSASHIWCSWLTFISHHCRRTPTSASRSLWSQPSSWWSVTCAGRWRRGRKRATATRKSSSSNRKSVCADCRYATRGWSHRSPLITVWLRRLQFRGKLNVNRMCD